MASLLNDDGALTMARVLRAVHQRQAAAREFLVAAADCLDAADSLSGGEPVLLRATEADIATAVHYLAANTATGVPEVRHIVGGGCP